MKTYFQITLALLASISICEGQPGDIAVSILFFVVFYFIGGAWYEMTRPEDYFFSWLN